MTGRQQHGLIVQVKRLADMWLQALPEGPAGPAGFQEDRQPQVGQARHERQHLGLEQWFTPGDFHERSLQFTNPGEQRLQRPHGPLVKGVRRIAPDATGIAHRGPHEDAGQAGEGGFSLDAAVNLVNEQRAGGFVAVGDTAGFAGSEDDPFPSLVEATSWALYDARLVAETA